MYFRWSEAVVMILFTTLALLWLTRNPGFMPGWGSLAPNMSDSTVAMGIVVLFFVFPYQRPVLFGGSPKTKSKIIKFLYKICFLMQNLRQMPI